MGHGWRGMRKDVTNWISECAICQKIKYQRDPKWQEDMEHHLYSSKPLDSLSIDTLGPLAEDQNGNSYVVVIVDNFSKFIGLYPAKNTTSEEFVRALLQWVGVFGIPHEIRTDGGSQFNSKLAADFKSLLRYDHLVVVAYRPQANGIAERRMAEVMKHLRALVIDTRIKEVWSQSLPLVQRIINYSIDGSIGTQPARVILGDLATEDLVMDLPSDWKDRNVAAYLVKLRETQATLIRATHNFLKENQRKRRRANRVGSVDVAQFHEGQFVLLEYPNRPPNKLAGLYRGPLVITSIDRPDLIRVKDLITNRESLVHTSRLRVFRHPKEMTLAEATALAAVDLDEFYVEGIVQHEGSGNNPKKWKYKVRWLGYEEGDDTWLPYSSVKNLKALDDYAAALGISIPE
jgi:hypothetical protein